MLKQNPKDPVWVVQLTIPERVTGTTVLGVNGAPMATKVEHGEQTEITVHAADEKAAKAYVEQQNPGANVLKVEASQ